MIYGTANNLGIALYDKWLFRNVSIEIHEGERLALIGPNGSGKSTLLKVLNQAVTADEGDVAWKRGLRIGYLEQTPCHAHHLTVDEILRSAFSELNEMEAKLRSLESTMANCGQDEARLRRVLADYAALQQTFEDRGGYTVESKIQSITQGLGIPTHFLEQPFGSLSGGEKTKVGLACLLLFEPDVVLLDEPTNHLDLVALEWLESFLSKYLGAVMIVSHDRYFLDAVANRVVELDGGQITTYLGNYSSAMQQREVQLLLDFQAYEEQRKKIEQMQAAIARLRDWANRSNPPNAGLHRRATNMQRALDRMEKLKRPILERRKMALSFDQQDRSGQNVVVMTQVSKIFDEQILLEDVTFQIRYQERTAIVGPNGAGKSTILKIIMGELQPDFGQVRVGASIRIGYLSQNGLDGYDSVRVIDAFRDVAPMTEGDARRVLARFLFYGEAVYKPVKVLSGGERMRLRLAQLSHQDINFLVLDEPTNHLDIESREVLEDAIEAFDGTVLAVSHDRHFVNRLFDKVVWLSDGRVTTYLGNYDDAKQKRATAR